MPVRKQVKDFNSVADYIAAIPIRCHRVLFADLKEAQAEAKNNAFTRVIVEEIENELGRRG